MMDTSATLLERLRAGVDPASWNRLIDIYTPIIRSWVRRYGLQPHDADDLVQNVLVELHRELPAFEYDKTRGLFRSWLRTITVNRLRAFWRVKKPKVMGGDDTDWQNQFAQLADPHSGISKLWNEEHDRLVTQRALDMIQPDFEPQSWLAFKRVVQDGEKADVVAKELGMERGAVYTAKSRILKRLREYMAGILEDDSRIFR